MIGENVLQRIVRIPYLPYVVAVLGACLVFATNFTENGPLKPFVTTVTYVLVVLAAAGLGGWKPGILSTLMCIVGWHFLFDRPAGASLKSIHYLLPLLAFLIVGIVVSVLSEALLRAWRRLADRQRQLEAEIDERIRAEAHSHERAERLRVTLASIGDAVITTDVDGKITTMNPVAESLTGWQAQDAKGRPVVEVFRIVHERTRHVVDNPCQRVLQTGTIVGLANHTVLIARDGREMPIDDSAAPIKDAAGNLMGVVLVFRDATQERAAKAGLQQLASIVEHSEDAIIGKTIDGTITSWNAAAEKLFGYSAREAIGRSIEIIMPPEKHQELADITERLIAGEKIEQLDTLRLRKDGTIFHVSLQMSPIRDADGNVIGASKIARDITERKSTEEAIKILAETTDALAALTDRESALQRAVITVVPFFADWCVARTLDSDGNMRIPVVHHRDPTKCGVLRELMERYPLDWNSSALAALALRTGQSQYVAEVSDSLLRSIARDERHFALIKQLNPRSIISVPLTIRGRTIGVLTFALSESARRYRQRDVKFAGELAGRVATAIDNSELLESLRAADRQKDEFLAMLAHELRNPLAAIDYANSLIPMADADAIPNLVELVHRQIRNLSHLIDGLLDVSRISRDKIQLRKEHCDGLAIVRRAAEVIRPQVEEKRHKLIMDLQIAAMPLHADATRVEQVLTNILANAVKYTPDGGKIWLTVSENARQAVISVKDSGIGISPDVLPQVFELFAQAEQGLDRSQGGLGIGLTIARKLAEMHGGTVAARSDGIGRGAEFVIRLPLDDESPAESRNATPQARQMPKDKLRILVVDDNRDTVRAQSMLLSAHGHEVQTAYDGPAAVASAERFRPHAILLDLGLPVMNGYEVAETLRAKGFAREMIIAISGYGRPEDQQRCHEAGFDHHFTKPVDQNALVALLNGVCPSKRGAPS